MQDLGWQGLQCHGGAAFVPTDPLHYHCPPQSSADVDHFGIAPPVQWHESGVNLKHLPFMSYISHSILIAHILDWKQTYTVMY